MVVEITDIGYLSNNCHNEVWFVYGAPIDNVEPVFLVKWQQSFRKIVINPKTFMYHLVFHDNWDLGHAVVSKHSDSLSIKLRHEFTEALRAYCSEFKS